MIQTDNILETVKKLQLQNQNFSVYLKKKDEALMLIAQGVERNKERILKKTKRP